MPTSRCIGTAGCLSCGADNPVRENERGALNLSCGFCDLSAYAKKGTQAERAARARMKPITTTDDARADAKGADAVAAAAKPAAKRSGAMPWMRS